MRREARLGRSREFFSEVILTLYEYWAVMNRVARFWMDSKLSERYACEGCHMDEAYSSFGRTNVKYASFFISAEEVFRFGRK